MADLCGVVYASYPVGKKMIDFHCKLPKGHDNDHQGAQIHAASVEGPVKP